MSERSRVVLITGAAGDIGGAVALRLAAEGCSVALTDHPAAGDRLADLATSIVRDGGHAWHAASDVTDIGSLQTMVDQCCRSVGAPTGLFNSAGVQGSFVAIPDHDLAEARQVMEVNVLGTLAVLEVVTARMIAAGAGGAVVNAASMAGVSGAPNMPAYSASKAAVIGLTKSAAKDLAPWNIRVNAVSPAFIGPGAMWDRQVAMQAAAGSQYFSASRDEVARQMLDMVPLRRYGSPAEVAAVVAFLLSDDASYVTGQNIEITGGST